MNVADGALKVLTTNKKGFGKAPWGDRERGLFKPTRGISTSDWANDNRYLSEKETLEPGKWKTSRVPFTKLPMDLISNPSVEGVVLCWAAQCCKTQIMFNGIGRNIDADPAPAMFAQSTKEIVENTSKGRITYMVEGSPVLKNKFKTDKSDIYTKKFIGMDLRMVGANSPSDLSSLSIRDLYADEVDKYPEFTGREASPFDLMYERTTIYEPIRTIVMGSTPTTEGGVIWQSLLGADVLLKYFVPCPHCGHYQVLIFDHVVKPKEGMKDDKGDHLLNKIVKNTGYECQGCKEIIRETHKRQMLEKGEWRPIYDEDHHDQGLWPIPDGERVWVALHLSKLYSPWATWGEMMKKFLKAKDRPNKMMNFKNSDEGVPFEEQVEGGTTKVVLDKKLKYQKGTVPDAATILLGAADIMENTMCVSIRAFEAETMTSWLVWHQDVETFEDIHRLFRKTWFKKSDGTPFQVFRAFIDSGYRTSEVYRFCWGNRGVLFPCKGFEGNNDSRPFFTSTIYKTPEGDALKGGIKLYNINTHMMKDDIWTAIKLGKDEPGSMFFHNAIDESFAKQITAEKKVRIRPRGAAASHLKWRKSFATSPNHYFDDEVYMWALAKVLNVDKFAPNQEPLKAPVDGSGTKERKQVQYTRRRRR